VNAHGQPFETGHCEETLGYEGRKGISNKDQVCAPQLKKKMENRRKVIPDVTSKLGFIFSPSEMSYGEAVKVSWWVSTHPAAHSSF
jgi:hypothetical protein